MTCPGGSISSWTMKNFNKFFSDSFTLHFFFLQDRKSTDIFMSLLCSIWHCDIVAQSFRREREKKNTHTHTLLLSLRFSRDERLVSLLIVELIRRSRDDTSCRFCVIISSGRCTFAVCLCEQNTLVHYSVKLHTDDQGIIAVSSVTCKINKISQAWKTLFASIIQIINKNIYENDKYSLPPVVRIYF